MLILDSLTEDDMINIYTSFYKFLNHISGVCPNCKTFRLPPPLLPDERDSIRRLENAVQGSKINGTESQST